MTYTISDREKEIVNDPARYPNERIEANLALLRVPGAAEAYDKDFAGYTAAWIEVLEAEQQRRLMKE